MARLTVALFLLFCSASALGQVATACPWVTTGTAERLLGGEVSVTTHVQASMAGSCSFVRQSGNSVASIEILIGPTDTYPCPSDSVKVKALGNEAVECHHGSPSTQRSDQIAGRIRKVFFVVTMINTPGAAQKEAPDPNLSDSYGASPLERLAEQVVGNLY
jgi:hypothetical protein